MTKSKITLITSSSQKFVIYLDPKKEDKKKCYSKCAKSQSYEEKYSNKSKNRRIITDSIDKDKDFIEENFDPRLDVPEGSGSSKDFQRFEYNEVDQFNASGNVELSEQRSETIFDEERDFEEGETLPNDVLKTDSWENLETDQLPEEPIVPHKSTRFENDSEHIKEGENAERPKNFTEEHFIKSVANILEANSLTTRKKQFDDLLRNISALQINEAVNKAEAANITENWWPFPKFNYFKKDDEEDKIKVSDDVRDETPDSKPTPLKRISSPPYFNHSFYHYRAKSRLEGLTFVPNKIYNYGEKGSGFQSKSEPQDFYKIQDQYLAKGSLFEDPEFPPTNSSLFYTHKPDKKFVWKRPKEIVKNPQLFVEGFSRFDIQQGELGDCWLLAAIANLTLYKRLFSQIVPDDQSFDQSYVGVFHFRFWQYGRWIDVVIDDRLPTFKGKLVFLHSTEINEFWSALLEKAYAKLHGSYEALKGGSTCEAMEDLTGGVTETYELKASPPNLFKIIVKAYERWSLMGCSIDEDSDVVESQTPEGLIRGHAYSITKAHYIDLSGEKIPLLRLRNPWGNASEWNGAWSDNSREWKLISEKQKKELGLNFEADGEFWMSFTDFLAHFNHLDICSLNPDSLADDELKEGRNKRWVMSLFEGEWVRGVTAGGCRNFLNTFHHNPQYRITLEEADEEELDNKCTLIVALMQKNRRQFRRSGGVDLLTIGFAIYQIPRSKKVSKPLRLSFFKYNPSLARSPKFINLREVSCRFRLPKGTYCIVPSTFDPNEEGEFLIRVFSEQQNNMEENDQKLGFIQDGALAESKLSTNEIKENELVRNLFKQVAGRDEEVDWKELKEILDYYTKKGDHP